MQQTTALETLRLALIQKRQEVERYEVPDLWIDPQSLHPHTQAVNPYDFYLRQIAALQARPAEPCVAGQPSGGWSRQAITYNLFVRLATAWDHNCDGSLDIAPTEAGWRETGTFLKTIAILPYIKALGCNTLHLLPITSIGQDSRKGPCGSPYAIRDHYALDETLAEPTLGVGVETEFKALVEAAHHLGMRVVLEFVLRTTAKDAVWVPQHPEWFYWIRADLADRPAESDDFSLYGLPYFTHADQDLVRVKFAARDFHALPAPDDRHRTMFTAPPAPETIRRDARGRWIGSLPDGTRTRIASAFADWPIVGDQPPWTDVTYLRLYDHPDFNYIAYNTVRIYDAALAQPAYRVWPLWQELAGIIPHYQTRFGIDGVMLDMSHGLPAELKHMIVERARQLDPDFAIWTEDFTPLDRIHAVGANAVMRIPFVHLPAQLAGYTTAFETWSQPLWMMATSENHNTPRTATYPGATLVSRAAVATSVMLPCMPWIQSGFELGETQSINPVLNVDAITAQELAEQFPLFGASRLQWTNPDRIVEWVVAVLALRQRYQSLLGDLSPQTFQHQQQGPVWIFMRGQPDQDQPMLVLLVNYDVEHAAAVSLALPEAPAEVVDLLSSRRLALTDEYLQLTLDPGMAVYITW